MSGAVAQPLCSYTMTSTNKWNQYPTRLLTNLFYSIYCGSCFVSVLTCLYIYPFFDQWTNGFVGFLKVLVIGFAHQFSFFFLSHLISFIMRSFPDTPGFFLVSLRPLKTWVTKSMYFLTGFIFMCLVCMFICVWAHTCAGALAHI